MHSHNHSQSHEHSEDSNCNEIHEEQNADYLEQRHQHEVKSAFSNYSKDMRISNEKIFGDKKLIQYFQLVRERKRQQLQKAIQANQKFLNLIVQYSNRMKQNTNYKPDKETMCHNISKIRTTVKQFYRQWCSQSPQLADYLKLVQYSKKYMNKNDKVLVPGCGLARLPLELIEAGFHVQGNEVTYFMLYGSDFILNCADQKQKYEIYPFIHTLNHHQCDQDMFRSVRVPDKIAVEVVPEGADFSMAAGQFTQIYQKSYNQFNGVVTCFFIDTANNIFQYIDTIYNILADNGVWINYGPLLYHYKDMLDQVSIELSWQQVEAYIKHKGFVQLQEQKLETTYCHDPLSSYKHVYKVSITAWKKITTNQT